MDINEIDNIIGAYSRLRSDIDAMARAKLAPLTKRNEKQRKHELNYLDLEALYVEDNKVIVEYSYREPYSGNEVVEISVDELKEIG